MTEYDYTPEAIERYISTQQRVANWVDRTEEHRPEFEKESGPSKFSFFKRFTQRRNSQDDRRRHRSTSPPSSTSSASIAPYSTLPHAPGPTPLAPRGLERPKTTPPYLMQPEQRPSHSRHHSSSHHHHRAPVYLTSPPTSPPVQGYPYPYGTTTNPGQPYVYPSRSGVSTAGSPTYYQSQTTSYFPQNSGYQMPGPYPTTAPYSSRPPLHHNPHTASAPYQYYPQTSHGQKQPLASPPAQYPQTAVYPPTIYPLSYDPQQHPPSQKPVFYQRIFSGSGSGGKKGKERRY